MRRWLRRLHNERVVLQTKDERSLRGVLVGVHADCLRLAGVQYLNEAQATDLPGEAIVLLDNLSWIHRYAATDGHA